MGTFVALWSDSIWMGSPVWGLRPVRALRFAFTALPSPGITNCPLLLASFVATVTSSARTVAAVFFGIPTFSAKCATTWDFVIISSTLPLSFGL